MSKKKLNKVEAEIFYTPKKGIKISDIMSRLDFGIDAIGITNTFSWTTSSSVTADYFKKMEKAIKSALELSGDKLLSIKWKIIWLNR
jgi:predicted Zn-dependent protease